MIDEDRYGMPVVTAATVYDVVRQQGIARWPRNGLSMSLAAYMAGTLTEEESREAERFAPGAEVVFLRKPPDGALYVGFTARLRSWASVFALLPDDLVPVVAEYKHGVDKVTLALPSGVPTAIERSGARPLLAAGMREFQRETGLLVHEVDTLSDPLAIAGRNVECEFQPLIAKLKKPIGLVPEKPDKDPNLLAVLFPLKEWLYSIRHKHGDALQIEDSAVSTTFLALLQLGRIEILPPPR